MNSPTWGSGVRVPGGLLEYVELQRAAVQLLGQYELEEDEHGFPFNFALRDAHRELRAVLRRHAGHESESVA